MGQDQIAKERYEHEAQARKQAREDAVEQRVENAYFLDSSAEQIHVDPMTGREAGAPSEQDRDLISGDQIKHVYDLLPSWHKDDLRRLAIVRPGTQLAQNNSYIDLHALDRGEFRARGDEVIQNANQLIVSKKDTDYEVWDRLTRGEA